ncbi:glutaminyl-peptide cyclotransferase [Chryseobacterium antibioticum]|uniref:Glutaminyl-peptide cyclotransferase n=1 Tax=Chryseobacterium pyrolae TaxID=2987481 RepID=A0ABT2ICE2_9FLAO|nr:glutaminyl-peptide cyclotransferase [Chryseobacterium pyrolae]MCT2406305.1 glutaminyl-peptide cyclotransferase [Chryseobacterium pyrolae]
MIKNSLKIHIIAGLASIFLLSSCNNKEKMLDSLADYNNSKETKGYHFGDQLNLPKEVTDHAETITISFGENETSNLTVDPKFFTLGDNDVTFIIKTKSGETLNQDATINVFAKNPEQNISYAIIAEYPHDPTNFVEGFLMEGNTVYESAGLDGASKLIKYTLGSSTPAITEKQPAEIFSEGCAIVGDKIYQLTYKNKIGFVYDKNSLRKLSQFPLPNVIGEGWGLTYDGKNLVATDGSKNLYFLDVNDPSKVVRTVAVAGHTETYANINELEYHNGFIYSNVWHQPIILKINPATGEAVGKFDFTKLTKENDQGNSEHVLNGIAFKGNNMLVTGKNWSKIYEVAIQ